MRTKNIAEFRLRARAHARLDHVVQGTYGKASVNGDAEFKGCLIGCLSTPHRKRSLIRYLREHIGAKSGVTGFFDDDAQVKSIEREFGIPRGIQRIAENIFEAFPFHGEAINFLPEFADAIPEGVVFTHPQIKAFQGRVSDLSWIDAHEPFLDWLRSRTPKAAVAA